MIERVSRMFRTARMRWFVREFGITDRTRVLDVGGTGFNWALSPVQPRLTILNMPQSWETTSDRAGWVVGDGCALPFRDGSFDVVFSNSVIEHVGTRERQQQFAAEVARVGIRYCVQTPNRWFPVETHLLTPCVHFFPKRWQAMLVRRWTVWQMLTGIRGERRHSYIEHYLADVHLLDANALQALFPEATVVRERFAGWTKSLIACHRHNGSKRGTGS